MIGSPFYEGGVKTKQLMFFRVQQDVCRAQGALAQIEVLGTRRCCGVACLMDPVVRREGSPRNQVQALYALYVSKQARHVNSDLVEVF